MTALPALRVVRTVPTLVLEVLSIRESDSSRDWESLSSMVGENKPDSSQMKVNVTFSSLGSYLL